MTSVPIRDAVADHLITPQNAALIVIDYQQNQFRSVRSMDSDLLLENVVSTAKLAKRFGLPIVHSTVGVAAGQDQSTLPGARRPTRGLPTDRPNDDQLVGRRRLPHRGSRDRTAQTDPVRPLDRDEHGVHRARCDARAARGVPRRRRNRGHVNKAHRAGLERVTQAGAQPISWISARRRATARLGAGRDRSRNYRDRLHRPPVDGMSRKSALMERSRTDHTRDPLCPARS